MALSVARGERRSVHIILIAACQIYNYVVVIRTLLSGHWALPGYETRQTVASTFFQSRETWAVSVVGHWQPGSHCAQAVPLPVVRASGCP